MIRFSTVAGWGVDPKFAFEHGPFATQTSEIHLEQPLIFKRENGIFREGSLKHLQTNKSHKGSTISTTIA